MATLGRPTDFDQAITEEVCIRLMDGESLRSIVKDEHMPERKTIYNWLHKNDSFLHQYAKARKIQSETYFDEMVDIADDGSNDYYEKTTRSGEVIEAVDHENINRSRLRVDTRKYIHELMQSKGKIGEDAPPIQVNITMRKDDE